MARHRPWVMADALLGAGTRTRRLVVRKVLLIVAATAALVAVPAVAVGYPGGGPGGNGGGDHPRADNVWPPGADGPGDVAGLKVFYVRGEVVSVDTAAGTITANVVC